MRLALAVLLLTLSGCGMPVVMGGAVVGLALSDTQLSTHSYPDDWAVRRAVVARLHADEALWQEGRVQVNVLNRIVLLSGELPDPALSARAEAHALEVAHVRLVYNDIITGGARGPHTAREDRALRQRVEAALMARHGLPRQEFEVASARGSVYLLGQVPAALGADLMQTVRAVEGVVHAVNLLEYLEPE